jgi:hypothetical protein
VDLDFWRVAKLPLAERRRLLDGVARHVCGLDVGVQEPDAAVAAPALAQRQVLANEHADPDAARVKRVEEAVDGGIVDEPLIVAYVSGICRGCYKSCTIQ